MHPFHEDGQVTAYELQVWKIVFRWIHLKGGFWRHWWQPDRFSVERKRPLTEASGESKQGGETKPKTNENILTHLIVLFRLFRITLLLQKIIFMIVSLHPPFTTVQVMASIGFPDIVA